jgi:hypothetical protein
VIRMNMYSKSRDSYMRAAGHKNQELGGHSLCILTSTKQLID